MPQKHSAILSYPFMNSFALSVTGQIVLSLNLKMSTWDQS